MLSRTFLTLIRIQLILQRDSFSSPTILAHLVLKLNGYFFELLKNPIAIADRIEGPKDVLVGKP